MSAATKPTKAQLQRLKEVCNGHLTKSGTGWHTYYHMKNSSSPSWDMVSRLEDFGWIEWAGGNMARLTDAGRQAIQPKPATPAPTGE